MKGKTTMNRLKIEKFEMKYGYYLPSEYKAFLYKYGGDSQFGSCRFEYADSIVSNTLRLPGEMDFHLVPFGDIGNGDYYCFYRYGIEESDYYIGIWLSETKNFVVLASDFKSFMYKCMLDDYMSTLGAYGENISMDIAAGISESLERCEVLSREYGFDFKSIKKMANDMDYHNLMVQHDPNAIQSLCFIGKKLLSYGDDRGRVYLKRVMDIFPQYTAPYYIYGKSRLGFNLNSKIELVQAISSSLVTTGYSYWEEDYLEIPEDVHREILLYADSYIEKEKGFLEKSLCQGRDPYDADLRIECARRWVKEGNISKAICEYSNALFCCEDKEAYREILGYAFKDIKDAGIYYLEEIIAHDLRQLR